MKSWQTYIAAVCIAVSGLHAQAARNDAQAARLKLQLDSLAPKSAEVADVNLDGPLLRLAAAFIRADKDEDARQISPLLSKLQGIYVKSFQFDRPGEYSNTDIEPIRRQLRSPGWSRVVNVFSRRDGETAEVYMLATRDGAQGIAIIDAEPTELTVVNLVGPIDAADVARLGGHLGIPELEQGGTTTAGHSPKPHTASAKPRPGGQ